MRKPHILLLSAVVAAIGLIPAAAKAESFANPGANIYWAHSGWDANSPDSIKAPVHGNNLLTAIPTDASQSIQTTYDGWLLCNITGKTSLTATFHLNNSALAPDAAFNTGVASAFAGDDPVFQFAFTGLDLDDGAPNIWWSNPSSIVATSP